MSLLLLLRPAIVRDTVHTSQVPEGSFNDGTGLTLGTVFKSDTAGSVVGVRMYRAATPPTGPVTGGLFTLDSETSGTLLASATFGTLGTGWNTVLFSSPAAVAANTLYVAAYFTPDHYVSDWDFWAAPVVNGHLTGIQQGQPVSNGRFNVGASLTFPGSNGNFASYFADPIFEASAAGPVTVTLGQAVESDTAGGLARVKQAAVGRAVEVDAAGGLVAAHRRMLVQAAEADTAAALTRRKVRLLGQSAELDTATALARSKSVLLGRSVEVDTAGALSAGGTQVRVLGRAVEVDTAFGLARTRRVTLAQAAEVDAALPLARRKVRLLGRASEVDAAGVLASSSKYVTRPDLGLVARPGTGFVVRPYAGVVSRP